MEKPPEPPPPAAHDAPHLLSQPITELDALALLEPWINFVPQQQRRLGLFICLALALHAGVCLFLVIDVYVAQMRHVPHLYVSVDYPRARAVSGTADDSFWDQVTDPRVFLLPRNPTGDLALNVNVPAPSASPVAEVLPQPAPPEAYREAQPAASPLEQEVADAMTPPRQSFAYDETPVTTLRQTTWHWEDALARRHPAAAPELPTLVSDTNITPTRLLVGVDADGVVEHVLIEPISDDLSTPVDSSLTSQIVSAAGKIRFDPIPTPGLQWGRITIFWNYAAKPREDIVPTPPASGQ